MKDWQLFIIEILKQGKEYVQLVLPALIGLFVPSPLKKKDPPDKTNG